LHSRYGLDDHKPYIMFLTLDKNMQKRHSCAVPFARWGFDHRQPALSNQDEEMRQGVDLWPCQGQGVIAKQKQRRFNQIESLKSS